MIALKRAQRASSCSGGARVGGTVDHGFKNNVTVDRESTNNSQDGIGRLRQIISADSSIGVLHAYMAVYG